MNYYDNAVNWYESAKYLASGGFYQQAVSQSCIAVELFLKSKLLIIEPDSELDKSHDVINIFSVLSRKYPAKKDILPGIRYCRKYFNESRYPHDGVEVYTKDFAESFIGYVGDVKDYIDNDCQATLGDLQHKYN